MQDVAERRALENFIPIMGGLWLDDRGGGWYVDDGFGNLSRTEIAVWAPAFLDGLNAH